jgi:titin
VTWYHGQRLIFPSEKYRLSKNKKGVFKLEVQDLGIMDAGVWKALVVNAYGQALCSCTLAVLDNVPLDCIAPRFMRELRRIHVAEGSTIRFDCKVFGDPEPEVKWYKDRKAIMDGARYQMLTEEDDTCSLIIPDVALEDRGFYMCLATNMAGTAMSEAQLRVEGLIYDDIYQRSMSRVSGSYASSVTSDQESTRSSLSSRRKKRYDSAPTFTAKLRPKRCAEGLTVRFNCSVSGLPMPDVAWFHGNKMIAEGGRYNIANNYGLLSLEISKVTKEDGGMYTVKATNLEGEVACSASLDIQDSDQDQPRRDGVRKPNFILEANNAWAEVGYKAVMEAQASGKPTPTFKWLKDNVLLEDGGRFKMFSDENGNTKLVIKDIMPSDSGFYFCVAENVAGKAKCAATLRVVDKGQLAEQRRSRSRSRETTPVGGRENVTVMGEMSVPKAGHPRFLQLPPQEVTLRQGDPLVIRCQVDGQPIPSVTWFKGTRELGSSKRLKISQEGRDQSVSLLQLPTVSDSDAGQYIVCAENINGRCQASVWVDVLPQGAQMDEENVLRSLRLQLPNLDYDIEKSKSKEFGKTPPKFVKKLPLETEVSSGSSFEFCCALQDEAPLEEFKTAITRKVEGGTSFYTETSRSSTRKSTEMDVGQSLTVLTPLEDAILPPGGSTRLTAEVNQEVNATWKKDGRRIQDGRRHKVLSKGMVQTLEIAEVAPEDSGVYEVSLSNGQESVSTSCSLTVKGGDTFEE